MEWCFESLQFVLFQTAPSSLEDALSVWQLLSKEGPAGYQKNPDPANPISFADGKIRGHEFRVQCAIGRVDVFVMGTEDATGFPSISSVPLAVELLRECAAKLSERHKACRLAMVATLFQDHATLDDVNYALSDILGVSRPKKGVTDLSYTINVRTPALSCGVTLNRVCRLTAQIKQILRFQIVNGMQVGNSPIERPALFFNVDVNTVLVNPSEAISDPIYVFDALVSEMMSIKDGGLNVLTG